MKLHTRSNWIRKALAIGLFGCGAFAVAAPSVVDRMEPGDSAIAHSGSARAATITGILDRWQPVAVEMGQKASIWRDVMGIQLSQMTASGLAQLAALDPGSDAQMYSVRLKSFVDVLGADIGARYTEEHRGMAVEKVLPQAGLTFTAIAPCRLVDTRFVGGQIAALATRNFYFYSTTTTFDFGTSQGGVSGPIGTACPGVVYTSGAPVAAMVTVTVVSQGSAGNLIGWDGTNPVPNTSVLNYGTFSMVGSIANTTIVPGGGRTGTGPGGNIKDFAVKVNAAAAADVIVDVVGYFVPTQASASGSLQCAWINNSVTLAVAGTYYTTEAKCSAGYTLMGGGCYFSTVQSNQHLIADSLKNTLPTPTYDTWICGGTSNVANDQLWVQANCCRIQ